MGGAVFPPCYLPGVKLNKQGDNIKPCDPQVCGSLTVIFDSQRLWHISKVRNGMDLTEAEDIKKRCQEYTEDCTKKNLNDPDNHDGVITHLEQDILECEVKWALGSVRQVYAPRFFVSSQQRFGVTDIKAPWRVTALRGQTVV